MTEKELAIYIKRIVAHLQTICDQLSESLPPEMERFKVIRKQLKPEIKKQVEEWKKEHPFALSDIPKEFNQLDSFEEITEDGIIKVLEPLYNMIDDLSGDISIIMPSSEE